MSRAEAIKFGIKRKIRSGMQSVSFEILGVEYGTEIIIDECDGAQLKVAALYLLQNHETLKNLAITIREPSSVYSGGELMVEAQLPSGYLAMVKFKAKDLSRALDL